MSVQNQTPFNSYTANGATTVFPFTFLLLEAGDLTVEVGGVVQTTGFSVSGIAAPGGGDVTFTVAPANGVKVLLNRVLTLQRLTDYQNNGDLLAATLNKDFDRIWQSMQQLLQNDIRALKLPFDTATDQVIPEDAAARANKGVKFDASGNLILSDYDPDGAQTDSAAAAAAAAASASAASSSEANAAASESAAAASEAAAAASATQAANSAASIGFTLTDLQTQGKTAVTSAGTAPNFTADTNPDYGAYAAGQRMRVKFHAAGTTGSNTLNRDGLGAKNLMQYDATGTKVAAVVAANQLADVEYDGTDMVILDPLPPAASGVSARQTVLGGPVDSSGFPSFLPATSGSLSITSQNINSGSGRFVATAALGFNSSGPSDRVGQSTANLTWNGLTANTTNFLYVDVGADGTLTPGSTTLAPTYQFGGSASSTNGQATYNIQEAKMYVGNGSSSASTARVFVGEADTNASTVTATRGYAYQGRYVSGEYSLGTAVTAVNHNIGVVPLAHRAVAVCKSADAGFAIGDEIPFNDLRQAGGPSLSPSLATATDRNSAWMFQNTSAAVMRKSDATLVALTQANWRIKTYANRGW